MEAEAIDTSRDPAIPYALRDDIGERLESFCKHHGSQLGHRLWNEWLQGVVISVANFMRRSSKINICILGEPLIHLLLHKVLAIDCDPQGSP